MMRDAISPNKPASLTLVLLLCAGMVACSEQRPGNRVGQVVASTQASTLEPAASAHTFSSDTVVADNRRPLKLPLKSPKIVVRKGARRLTLYSDGVAVRDFPAALGFNPVGDKVRQGDGRTPEGTFYVCLKNEKSMFHLSLGLTYPSGDDADRGLRDKLITRRQYERIMSAAKAKRKPPWDTRLGGEIFIHGGGATGDWTWGCVALENEAIKELFDAVTIGSPVVIEP